MDIFSISKKPRLLPPGALFNIMILKNAFLIDFWPKKQYMASDRCA